MFHIWKPVLFTLWPGKVRNGAVCLTCKTERHLNPEQLEAGENERMAGGVLHLADKCQGEYVGPPILFILRASALGTLTSEGGFPLYWKDLDGRWTRHKAEARKMPLEAVSFLASYLEWEKVPVVVEPA